MNKALEAINLYLSGKIDLPSLEGLVVPLAWDDGFEDQDLVDLVSIEIRLRENDGVSDESTLIRHAFLRFATKESQPNRI